MSEFTAITTPDGTFSAYVARPATKPARVLVVLQEIFVQVIWLGKRGIAQATPV